MTDREEYVRSRWFNADGCGTKSLPVRVWYGNPCYAHVFESWSAAYAFTLEREEQIREVREEMALLRGMIALLQSEPGDETTPIYQRTINRLQEIVAELRKGMRQ